MSHQSGIEVSESLRDSFGNALQDESIRLIVARIEGEQIVQTESKSGSGDWKADLDMVPSVLKPDAAAYVLFRGERGWILMAYVPDLAPVKDKMLYASTRATLKRMLGTANFPEEIHGTLPADFNKSGYDAWKTMKEADAPLSRKELHAQEELEMGEIYRGGASMHVHGVSFDADSDVVPALQSLAGGSKNYVSIGIDTANERVKLIKADNLSFGQLEAEVPIDEPRFHFYRYKYACRGENYDEIVFIYTCPDGTGNTKPCPIKQRMLYSSSKARVLDLLKQAGGEAFKSFEYNEPSDLADEQSLQDSLHPPPVDNNKTFTRPKRAGKGARKLIRSPR